MIEQFDSIARIVYIEVPRAKIVLLHAIFESYDGLAVVRTVDHERGLLALVATESTLQICCDLLDSLRNEIAWRYAERPQNIDALTTYREC